MPILLIVQENCKMKATYGAGPVVLSSKYENMRASVEE